MKEKEFKELIYDEIETDKMGKEFKYKVKEIKEEQCSICIKKNKSSCRLELQENRCKNFTRRQI